jgi:nucleoside-diphosphate-sugar epimerase
MVTGASGFVGSVLCAELSRAGYQVRAAVRDPRRVPAGASEQAVTDELGPATRWEAALEGIDCVVHLAARAHVMRDSKSNAGLYMRANAQGTLRLATECARAGVRRFVFLSTIKVNGDATRDRPFSPLDEPRPRDAYGESKWEGEKHAFKVGREAGMEVAVVRSPLVYGPGVKGNFLALMRWVDKERPLPLARVANRRSLVNVWNLCDLVRTLLTRANVSGRVWMASDCEDMSTPELVRRMAHVMGRRARLMSVPVPLLTLAGAIVGRGAQTARLCGSLQVDAAATRQELGWSPSVPLEEGLRRTVSWYEGVKAHVG